MKHQKKHLILTCLLLALLAASVTAQSKPSAAFEKLKALAGEWEGKDSEGNPLTLSYELVSGSTAVMEKIHNIHGANMVTVYHADGAALQATHYCSIGNQPRMRAVVTAGEVKQLRFNFAGVSNLASPTAGHMRALTVNFVDADHFTQVWTYREKGKDSSTTFTLARKK